MFLSAVERRVIVDVTPEEAIQLIRSLAVQLETGNINSGHRLETRLADGRWFTIAVIQKKG